jgi:hypothetical protein
LEVLPRERTESPVEVRHLHGVELASRQRTSDDCGQSIEDLGKSVARLSEGQVPSVPNLDELLEPTPAATRGRTRQRALREGRKGDLAAVLGDQEGDDVLNERIDGILRQVDRLRV